jgi:uncharacterized membrane protein YuzA (DUF378 family)
MTFPIVVAVIGAILLSLGLLGKVQIQGLVGETTSTPVRIVLCIVGPCLLVVAFILYSSDRSLSSDSSNLDLSQKLKVVEKGPTVTITAPVAGEDVEVQLLPKGGGAFAVRGTSEGIAQDADLRVFVLVHPENPFAAGWWIQSPPVMESNGDWSGQAMIGNPQALPKVGDTLNIVAVAAARDVPRQSKADDPKDLKPVAQSKTVRLRIDPIKKTSRNRVHGEDVLAPTKRPATFSFV